MSAREPRVLVSSRGTARLQAGHVWIYRSDVIDAQAHGGEVVQVVARPGDRVVGRALYSDRSQIALRLLATGDVPIDGAFWRDRIAAALAFRRTLAIDASAHRLVNAEADLLPSLIVDRYGRYLVVQALSQAMDRQLPGLVPLLVELTGSVGVLARHDARVRELEGLDRRVELLYGEVPERIPVHEGSIAYEVDSWHGQKTGLFLDQRENRAAAAAYAAPRGGRALDCFTYHGGFALPLARAGASVTAVDSSEAAVTRLAENAARNGLGDRVDGVVANVFDDLRRRERAGETFETIVLDPPAFARNKAALSGALAGYREINLRALRLLAPGGCLVTCSCSYNVDEATFGAVVHEAALDARVRVTVLEKRMQGRDHPVLLGVPETYYLKCFVLRRVL